MTNLDSILKSRDITLPTKVHLVKAMVFPVVMYGCETWTVKKAERWRIDSFELWCWRKHLRVPCTARRSKESILKETIPGCSLEGLMLKLKLQYFGHLMRRVGHTLWDPNTWRPRVYCVSLDTISVGVSSMHLLFLFVLFFTSWADLSWPPVNCHLSPKTS